MISTAKSVLSVASIFTSIIFAAQATAQQPKFIELLKEVSGKVSVESAKIKIDDKDASYEEMLKIPDNALLKIEVYSKKEAIKLVGKEEGKNGLLLVTRRKVQTPHYNNSNQPHYIYNDAGDSMYCEHLTVATLNGDTTQKSWIQFLTKNLRPNTPVDNSAPPGIYYVDFSFIVNKDGTVSNVVVFEDPGYGCGGEVKRLMSKSPQWMSGVCESEPIKYKQKERVTFLVSEQ
jgi:hypothetical protein